MLRRETLKHLGLGGAALALEGQALTAFSQSAETFPSRSIKVVVPQPAGGGFDFVARVLADKMTQGVAAGVIVENAPARARWWEQILSPKLQPMATPCSWARCRIWCSMRGFIKTCPTTR